MSDRPRFVLSTNVNVTIRANICRLAVFDVNMYNVSAVILQLCYTHAYHQPPKKKKNCFKQVKMHSCAQKINKYGENGTRNKYLYLPSSRLASHLKFSFRLI